MPEISRFFGIIIRMYYNDHCASALHARYGAEEAVIGIDPLTLLHGWLPPRALALAMEWAAGHQAELLADWHLARQSQPLNPIEGLE